MNIKFMNLMLDRCGFPDDAKTFFNTLAQNVIDAGLEKEFDSFMDIYLESDCDTEKVRVKMEPLVEKVGGSIHSYWLLLFLIGAERAKPLYDARGVSDEVFFDTFSDLKVKAFECLEVKGVWGTFVEGWFQHFFRCHIIKFGRFEYHNVPSEEEDTYVFDDVKISKGDSILWLHIPSSGEPFDEQGRLESYKKAYDFYSKERGENKLVCGCLSWLLFPEYRDSFGAGNTRDFMDEYDIVRSIETDSFIDTWRVFGRHHEKPTEEYPEDTRMRRAFKKYILSGEKTGYAYGYLVFDGEKVLTKDRKGQCIPPNETK